MEVDDSMISDNTFLALIFNGDGEGFVTSYGVEGCQDLRRNALYTWMKQAIEEKKEADIDFLEIMVSVVVSLQDEGLIKAGDFEDLSPKEGEKERLVKFLDWFLERYYQVKGATSNQTRIVVEKYLAK